mgnify:CR=1 FL=1
MKKIMKISTLILTILVLFNLFPLGGSLTLKNEAEINDELDNTHFKITSPQIGKLYVFKTNISIPFLESIKWSVVVDSELCIDTSATEKVDYVVFTVKPNNGPIVVPEKYNKTVYDYPFNCCFDNLPTHLNYTLTATAYYNESYMVEDSVSPVKYIKNTDVIG